MNAHKNPTIKLVDVVFPGLTLTLGFSFATLAEASRECGVSIMAGLDLGNAIAEEKFTLLLYLAAKANTPGLTLEQVEELPFSASSIVTLSEALHMAWSGEFDQIPDLDPNEAAPPVN